MSDDSRVNDPRPLLRTRPATMLTAIGLCLFVMIMQLLPQFSDSGFDRINGIATTTTSTAGIR
jgi:hypothetical protein